MIYCTSVVSTIYSVVRILLRVLNLSVWFAPHLRAVLTLTSLDSVPLHPSSYVLSLLLLLLLVLYSVLLVVYRVVLLVVYSVPSTLP